MSRFAGKLKVDAIMRRPMSDYMAL